MKQNQSGSTVHNSRDRLNFYSPCLCSQCKTIHEPINPEINLDYELIELYKNKVKDKNDLITFYETFKINDRKLPNFQFLDTIILKDGVAEYGLTYDSLGRPQIAYRINIKQYILGRKDSMDLIYQKDKFQRQNKGFLFAHFQHESEKKIKQFQNNVKYMSSLLNRMVILKIKEVDEQKIITKNQFLDLFDATKFRQHTLEDIEYIQVFPVMYGEEEHSYLKTIKYFRNNQSHKKGFKLAEAYVSTWMQKNQTIQKLEENVYNQIAQANKKQIISEQQKLLYQTYKLFIYFEEISNQRIEEAVVQYITNNDGLSFYFKKIDCLRLTSKISVEQMQRKLPKKKEIALQDYIDLKTEMQKGFKVFQNQFERLQNQRMQMQSKIKKDKQYSNYVFKTITQRNGDNFHKILMSNNQRYKKEQLGL